MEKIPSDVMREMVVNLSPRDVLSLCLSNKTFSRIICDSKVFWRNKIKLDYPKQFYPLSFYEKNPKKLYMLLTMNSKVIELKEEDFSELYFLNFEDITLEEILAAVTRSVLCCGKIDMRYLKRGDILKLSWTQYYGPFIWDGKKALNLDYDIGVNGSQPQDFAFPEFRPDYFSDSITEYEHTFVKLTPEKVNECEKNFDIDTQTSFITDRYHKYTVRIKRGFKNVNIKYKRIFVPDSVLYYYIKNKKLMTEIIWYVNKFGNDQSSYFEPEIKDSIISISLTDPKTSYVWEGNYLRVFTNM